MKYGIVLANWLYGNDTDLLIDHAILAEDAGWDAVLLADHLVFPPRFANQPRQQSGPFPDPWITMAAIASKTEKIKLMSWVTPIPRRQPWQFARNLATLDQISKGRIILGTGLGRASDYQSFGKDYIPKDLGEMYDEALDIITSLWTGHPVSYEGDHYTLNDAILEPTPYQTPRIPIIVGGLWPYKNPIRRGIRFDGIIPHYRGDGVLPKDGAGHLKKRQKSHNDEVQDLLQYYQDNKIKAGDIFMPIDVPEGDDEYFDICRNNGVTWLYSRNLDENFNWSINLENIEQGPN